jgi:hypothetical protein
MIAIYTEAATRVTYNPATGKFYWLKRPEIYGTGTATWNSRFAGTECGKVKTSGHIVIRFKVGEESYTLPAHRLAWFIFYGELPALALDHINRYPGDNRICNLRLVTTQQNAKNASLSVANKSGVCGVRKRSNGSFEAYGIVGKSYIYLGVYKTLALAEVKAKEFRHANGYTKTHGELQ